MSAATRTPDAAIMGTCHIPRARQPTKRRAHDFMYEQVRHIHNINIVLVQALVLSQRLSVDVHVRYLCYKTCDGALDFSSIDVVVVN